MRGPRVTVTGARERGLGLRTVSRHSSRLERAGRLA